MAIQHRRGAYTDYDPSRLKPAEVAVVTSGDINASDGKMAYIAFAVGNAKRIVFSDELSKYYTKTAIDTMLADYSLTQAQITNLINLLN